MSEKQRKWLVKVPANVAQMSDDELLAWATQVWERVTEKMGEGSRQTDPGESEPPDS